MTLADLPTGQRRLISAIEAENDNQYRLNQLGVIPGCTVEVLRVAPLGDPLQIRIDNTLLSIRRQDAGSILVQQA